MKPGSDSTWFKVRKFDRKWILGIFTFLTVGGGGAWLISCAKENGKEAVGYLAKPAIDSAKNQMRTERAADIKVLETSLREFVNMKFRDQEELLRQIPQIDKAARRRDSIRELDDRIFGLQRRRPWTSN